MGGAFFTLLRRLVLAVIALAVLLAGVIYIFGPHASVATAYAAYKSAYDARDGATVARMTAPDGIVSFDAQRKRALTASRQAVAALSFRERGEVLGLRSEVLSGSLPLDVLSNPDAAAAYAAYVRHLPAKPSPLPAGILFAVPTGSGSARGYLDPAPGSGYALVTGLIVLAWGMYGEFEKAPEGWQVDMTPALVSSASENERLAVRMEPTGNSYIFQMLGAADAAAQDRLWQPLQQ
jgi:hypothetical protein